MSTTCKCKVGRCGTCDSLCKRCGCACDGKTPEEKLARKRGQHGKARKHTESSLPGPAKRVRVAKEVATNLMSQAMEVDKEVDGALRYESEFLPLASDEAGLKDIAHALMKETLTVQRAKATAKQSKGEQALRPESRSQIIAFACEAAKHVVRIMAPGHTSTLLPDIGKRLSGKLEHTPGDKTARRFTENCVKVIQNAPTGSLQRRVARAIMTKSLTGPEIQQVKEELLGEDPNNKLSVYASGADRIEAVEDFTAMVEGKALEKTEWTRQKFDSDAASFAVEYILSPRNVSTLSWGTRIVDLGCGENGRHELHRLPSLFRRKPLKDLYLDYVSECKAKGWGNEKVQDTTGGNDHNKRKKKWTRRILCESAFGKIAKQLTCGDLDRLSAEDVIVGELINDPCDRLQHIIDVFASPSAREALSTRLTLVRDFLKTQYDTHARREGDDVGTHGIGFGLAESTSSEPTPERAGKCNACMAVYELFASLRALVQESPMVVSEEDRANAVEVIAQQEENFVMYMAHRQRVVNQQVAIDAHLEALRLFTTTTKKRSTGYVVLNWENSSEPLGKQTSFGWHGCVIHYFEWDAEQSKAIRRTVYMDQVMSGSNTQNTLTSAAMLESFLWQVCKEMPWLESLILQSDNASCYHSKLLLTLIPFFNMRFPVKITRFIYAETQDDETLSHFAQGTQHVDGILKSQESNKTPKVSTASKMARVLASRGGMSNSVVQLVHVDHSQLEELENILSGMDKDAQNHMGRFREAEFVEPPGGWAKPTFMQDGIQQNPLDWLKDFTGNFIIRLWLFSGIGNGVEFTLRWGSSSFPPSSNQQVNASSESQIVAVAAAAEKEENDDDGCDIYRYHLNEDQSQVEDSFTGAAVVRLTYFEEMSRSRLNVDEVGVSPRKDILAFAIRKAQDLLVPKKDLEEDETQLRKTFSRGWARSDLHISASYIDEYKTDLLELFASGRDDPSSKQMNASTMLEVLQQKYPTQFSLPGEIEIHKEIVLASLKEKKGKKKRSETSVVEGNVSPERYRWPEHYTEALEQLIANSPSHRPDVLAQTFLATLQSQHGKLPDDLPQESINKNGQVKTQLTKIKTKISALKATLKKN